MFNKVIDYLKWVIVILIAIGVIFKKQFLIFNYFKKFVEYLCFKFEK